MRLSGTPFHFSYCLNVHPGETVEDLLGILNGPVPEIKQGLSPDQPFGLGLRLASRAARTLQNPEEQTALKQTLSANRFYAFTVNAFPYGAFHQTRVKENVYAPDWRNPERLAYTLNVFRILADLLPAGTRGSVSTVPLAYGAWTFSKSDLARVRSHFADLAWALTELEAATGKTLHLGLEPEPDCTLETTAQTVHWFQEELFLNAAADLSSRKGVSRDRAEALLRRHIGVCFDTCHVAMQFEDPLASLMAYTEAGILISKVQISAALECDASPDSLKALSAFDDGVYLHQVKSSHQNAWADLPALFASPPPDGATIRIHCHVPLHWPGDEPLRSTRETLTPEFWSALRRSGCEHLEVETYTFDVLPQSVRSHSLTENILSECKWALESLKRSH